MAKLKKLAALLLSGAMCVSFAFAFTACNSGDSESGAQNSEQTDDGSDSQTGEQTDNAESGDSTADGGQTEDAGSGDTDSESGGEDEAESGTQNGGQPDGNIEDGDDEGDGSTENNDAEDGGNAETDGTYYGKTYSLDFGTLDYYVDGNLSEEAKTEFTSRVMSGLTVTLTLQEDGTGTCVWTAYEGSIEIDISFDYTAVECTQISYTSNSSLNGTYFFNKTFTRDFSGVRFEFSNYVITKITEGGDDFADQLSDEEMEDIGSEYMNIYAYGYDGSDMVIYFAEEGFGEWAQYYYEEATGYYYYYKEGADDFYCEATGEYISDKDISTGYTFGAEYQYNESEIITAYGALKVAE